MFNLNNQIKKWLIIDNNNFCNAFLSMPHRISLTH